MRVAAASRTSELLTLGCGICRTRLLNWNISLSILLACILFFIPLSYSLVLSDRYSPSNGACPFPSLLSKPSRSTNDICTSVWQRPSVLRVVLNIIPVGLFLFLLSYIPLPAALPSSSLIMPALSRLTVLGTIILGLLSGFGAINTAWTFFPLFYGNPR